MPVVAAATPAPMALKEEQEEQEVALIFLWRGRRRWRGGRRWRVSEHEDLSTDDTKTRQPITHTHTHTHTHTDTHRDRHTHIERKREEEGGRGRKGEFVRF